MQAPTPPKGESKLSRLMRPRKKGWRVTLTASCCFVYYSVPHTMEWRNDHRSPLAR